VSEELVEKLNALFTVPPEVRSFKGLEQHLREKGREFLQCVFELLLRWLDEALYEEHPPGWTVQDCKGKQMDTVVGQVELHRRRYRDEMGEPRYLLDEALGLSKRQRLSPGLIEEIVTQAVEKPFREVERQRRAQGLPSVSHVSVHRWTRRMGERRGQEEAAQREAVFGRGELPPPGPASRVVFAEGDGLVVHAQREAEDHLEIKLAVLHRGWEPRYAGSREWRLKDRRVHAGVVEVGETFWEEVMATQGHRVGLWEAEQLVVNGDGAAWIDGALEVWGKAGHRQLDPFHVRRDLQRAYPEEEARRLWAALRRGEVEAVLDTMEADLRRADLPEATRRVREGLWRFLSSRKEQLRDYRRVLSLPAGEVWRGVGAAEASVDKHLAVRMKKQGMSWTRRGADAMARLRALRANGELGEWLARQVERPWSLKPATLAKVAARARRSGLGEWLLKRVPALQGPHAGRPWVKQLRRLIDPYPTLA